MNWQGKDSRRLVQQRVGTGAAFRLVSGNIISIHVGHQHIHLAKYLIGHGPIDKKSSQNKLFLIPTAREYFPEINHLDGSTISPPMLRFRCRILSRSERSTPSFVSTLG